MGKNIVFKKKGDVKIRESQNLAKKNENSGKQATVAECSPCRSCCTRSCTIFRGGVCQDCSDFGRGTERVSVHYRNLPGSSERSHGVVEIGCSCRRGYFRQQDMDVEVRGGTPSCRSTNTMFPHLVVLFAYLFLIYSIYRRPRKRRPTARTRFPFFRVSGCSCGFV